MTHARLMSRSSGAVSALALVAAAVLTSSAASPSASGAMNSADTAAAPSAQNQQRTAGAVELRAPSRAVDYARPSIDLQKRVDSGQVSTDRRYGRIWKDRNASNSRRANTPAPPTRKPPASTPPKQSGSRGSSSSTSLVPLGSNSVYTRSVRNAPIAKNSKAVVASLTADSRRMAVAVNRTKFNTPLYRVNSSTPRKAVKWTNCQGWGRNGTLPKMLTDSFSSVPIPNGALASPDTDQQIAIYDTDSDELWEFWKVVKSDNSYAACWGGRIDNFSKSTGVFKDRTGAAATSLSISATTISQEAVRQGRIDHAIGIAVPSSMRGKFSYPATRTDGYKTSSNLPLQGQRFRLDPSIDVNSLGLTPFATMVAKASQEYGMIVTNTAGAVALNIESSIPQVLEGKPDPWPQIFGARPQGDILGKNKDWSQMNGFPWDRMQAITPDWR